MTEYKVEKVYQPSGLPTWTVVEWVNGRATGGDHHWLEETTAHIAASAYRTGRATHGDSETTVLRKVGSAS